MKKGNMKFGVALFLFLFFIVSLFLLSGYDTVDASQKGVKVRFGKILGPMDPGRQWTGIFVDVNRYDLRIRNMEVNLEGKQAAVDKDGQEVYASIKVNYRLKPDSDTVLKAYSNLGKDRDLEKLLNLEGLVKEGFKSVIAKYELSEVLNDRSKIKSEAIIAIREKFPNDYFVLENIVIENFDFNEDIKVAINNKKVAEKNAETQISQLAVAEANRNIAIMEADSNLEVKKKQAEANAYEIERMAEAEARALKLKAQEITPMMIQQTIAENWNGNYPMYVAGDGMNMLMQLPTQVE